MDLQIPTGTQRSRRLSSEQILKIHVLCCSSLIASGDFADDTVTLLAGVMLVCLQPKDIPDVKKWLFPLNDSLKPKASDVLHALFKPATTS